MIRDRLRVWLHWCLDTDTTTIDIFESDDKYKTIIRVCAYHLKCVGARKNGKVQQIVWDAILTDLTLNRSNFLELSHVKYEALFRFAVYESLRAAHRVSQFCQCTI